MSMAAKWAKQQHDVELASLLHGCRLQAHEGDKEQPLPLLGLAQLSLLPGHTHGQQAVSMLESALAVQPAWVDAVKVRGKQAHEPATTVP